jgi:hypothetical protein
MKNKIRFWLLKKLFSQDEKYLMIKAIEDRVNNLERISVSERWANKEDIKVDCQDYKKLSQIFSTRDYA